jgi:photosystem II stability/assembly factor-like uncharacterized protein
MTRKSTALAFATALAAASASGAGFVDVLEAPARMSPLAGTSLLLAVTRAGDRLVAVGQRGHIVVSADGGRTWKQSTVPVSSDLTSVFFVDERRGWAAGHDGVILHTEDRGEHWNVQLTGRHANDLLLAVMERRALDDPGSPAARAFLEEAKRFRDQGPDKPFLDIWFADAENGFAVGAYNLVFRTVDGGRTWNPWFDRTDNPRLYNLYAIRRVAGEVYIAGEAGLVLRLDAAAGRFRAASAPYNGSFFGIADAGSAVIVYGLRGNAFRSTDAGRSWSRLDVGLAASIVAATRTGRALFLADSAGRIAASEDGGATFTPVAFDRPTMLTGIADAGHGKLVMVGPRGASVRQLDRP